MEIEIRDNLFRPSYETGRDMIKKLDADRLLAPCFEAMGKEPKKPRYGGWEARGISGHTLGHYMSALSYLYDYSGDEFAKETALYCVDTLSSLQGENGYISGFPENESFGNVFSDPNGFNAEGFELGGWWVPYYSLHKIFRGLLDIYEFVHCDKALSVAEKLGLWVHNTTGILNNEQRLRLLKCEYGGMNDVLSRLFRFTKDERFLKSAKFFCEEKLIEPLSRGEDILTFLHANTQIPKIIGALSYYECTGEEEKFLAAENFFNFVTENRSYAIGGHSIKEHFEECGCETLETNTCETCNTNNMLQLAKKLWTHNHSGRYYDFIEKALYNHILASQDETGMKTYFVSMKPGSHKVYSTPEDSFWCCFGSGLENPFNYGSFICEYDKALYINLYIPCVCKNDAFSFEIKGSGEKYEIKFTKAYSGKIYLRKPLWCGDFAAGYDKAEHSRAKDGYVGIEGDFTEGSAVVISLPKKTEIHKKRDDKSVVYFTFGETVLAERIESDDVHSDHAPGENDFTNQVCTECEKLRNTDIKKIGEELFSVDSHTLVPFRNIIHGRYRVYFETENQ